MEPQKIQPIPGKIVSREEVIQTLVVEGGILFAVDNVSDLTDEMLLSASVQVIDTMAQQRDKLMEDLKAEVHLTHMFYRACQRINVTVSRDENNEIKLTRV